MFLQFVHLRVPKPTGLFIAAAVVLVKAGRTTDYQLHYSLIGQAIDHTTSTYDGFTSGKVMVKSILIYINDYYTNIWHYMYLLMTHQSYHQIYKIH